MLQNKLLKKRGKVILQTFKLDTNFIGSKISEITYFHIPPISQRNNEKKTHLSSDLSL